MNLRSSNGPITDVAMALDGASLAASAKNGETVELWNLEQGKVVWSSPAPGSTRSLAFSPDGTTLATIKDRETVQLWQIEGSGLRTIGFGR